MNEIDIYEFVTNKQLQVKEELSKLYEEEQVAKKEYEDHLAKIEKRRKELSLELYVYDNYNGEELVSITTTTVSIRGRMPNGTKMRMQDSIRKIFELKGTGMGITELREELAKMEFHFSSYASAHSKLSSLDYIEKVDRGFYQYRKSY